MNIDMHIKFPIPNSHIYEYLHLYKYIYKYVYIYTHVNINRYGDKLTKESKLRDATEGREIELMRENASLRYIHVFICRYIYACTCLCIYMYTCI
jgi:hypothetical protein